MTLSDYPGESAAVLEAARAAIGQNMTADAMRAIAMTGEGGGAIGPLADCLPAASSRSTPLIQQTHRCLYHYPCASVECRMMA